MNAVILLCGFVWTSAAILLDTDSFAGMDCETDAECPGTIVKEYLSHCDVGHKHCVVGLECYADGTEMKSTDQPSMCCSGVANKYRPRHQLRCGKIPNNYFCASDGECQSDNCGEYNGHYRDVTTRTCAATDKIGLMANCIEHPNSCTTGTRCRWFSGRSYCYCDVHTGGEYRDEATTLCCNGQKQENTATFKGCRAPAAGAACINDIQCVYSKGINTVCNFTCNGENCVEYQH